MLLSSLRHELARPRTSVQLCLVGIVGGMSAALIIILFRLSFESLQLLFLEQVGDFSTLSLPERFFLPLVAVILTVLFAWLTGFKHNRTGIPYVIHRVKYHYGFMPLRNTFNQFVGGALALASGFVVGREGPSVHLGAAGSSWVGRWLKLPHNSVRILAGCGIAAGISASFNTPFAAMIFVMEVVLREYRIHVFIPIMLASACGSVMTRMVFGSEHELGVFQFVELPYWMYAYLIVFGIVLGALATLFNNNVMTVIRTFRRVPMWQRLLIAGLITGTVSVLQPQAMGASFEGVSRILDESSDMQFLLIILACKFALAVSAIGLGVPGGIMGPTMVIGLISGAILLLPLSHWVDINDYQQSFALLGLAGMLGAVLHAPMAALSAVTELAFAPGVILPAMLVIVPAYVTSFQLLGNDSVFTRQLDFQKLPYTLSSVIETLQKIGVMAVMDTRFKQFTEGDHQQVLKYLDQAPTDVVVNASNTPGGVKYSLVQYDVSLDTYADSPLVFFDMQGVAVDATLAEVYEILNIGRQGAVYVYDTDPQQIIGVITWNTLRSNLMREQY